MTLKSSNACHHLAEESCWFGISLAYGKMKGAAQVHGRVARPSYSEHRLKNTQQLIERSVRQSPQMLDETLHINSSQLVSNNMTVFTIKCATHSKRVWMTASCERRNNESA
jgi:hypothetical protein